jgi:hypothetical protein
MKPGKRNRTGYLIRRGITGNWPLSVGAFVMWVDWLESVARNFRRKGR